MSDKSAPFGEIEVQNITPRMFPFDAWQHENPARYANPRHILKDPWWMTMQPSFKAIGTSDWNYTAAADKYMYYYGTTGDSDRVFTLPAASGSGLWLAVQKVDSGTGDIDVTPNGSDNINGLNAVWKINAQYQYVTLQDRASGEWAVLDCLGTLLEFTSDSQVAITSPQKNTVYNPTSHSLSITPGEWGVSWQAVVDAYESNATQTSLTIKAGLSTANNTLPLLQFRDVMHIYHNAGVGRNIFKGLRSAYTLSLAVATTYYLNIYANNDSPDANLDWLRTVGMEMRSYIRARRIA